MSQRDRRHRGHLPSVEGLETRGLLDASPRALPLAVVREVAASALIPAIRGTIHGTVTEFRPTGPRAVRVTYAAVASVDLVGDGQGQGYHTVVSRRLPGRATADTYRNGQATATGATDTIAIRYVGTGRTRPNGRIVAELRGTAESIDGEYAGLSGSFTARLVGTSRTGPFTVTMTIRP